ncbi:hypothetical protein Y032_0311g2151 [Ancylostoma ceylanicum]|uniref:FAD dependent oxidoreductase domain-containing protein n=1 Tax=Ancylostoma ceylanicum TaxID=53326 RepID=A0A016S3B1_9BILA|nr:hypothetical protein Y032_0311g2151 [Ancylostoma ceylanicum]
MKSRKNKSDVFLSFRFLSNGGVIVKQKIESLDSIGTQYDCVVNCTGLGAGKLVKDENLHPIRGQVKCDFSQVYI